MSFATRESRVNASVMNTLANASGLMDGIADTIDGIFENPSANHGGGLGMGDVSPTFVVPTSALPVSTYGKSIVINNTTYKVVDVDSDGTGFSTLILERTA